MFKLLHAFHGRAGDEMNMSETTGNQEVSQSGALYMIQTQMPFFYVQPARLIVSAFSFYVLGGWVSTSGFLQCIAEEQLCSFPVKFEMLAGSLHKVSIQSPT